MNDTKVTFAEGVRISWERELKIGNIWRIIQLAFFTVYYGAIYYGYVVPKKYILRLAERDKFFNIFLMTLNIIFRGMVYFFTVIVLRALTGKTDWKK